MGALLPWGAPRWSENDTILSCKAEKAENVIFYKGFSVIIDAPKAETTEKAILSLKKCHVDLQISELQYQISEGEIDTDGIKKLSKLIKIKTHIAKILGRNIG